MGFGEVGSQDLRVSGFHGLWGSRVAGYCGL